MFLGLFLRRLVLMAISLLRAMPPVLYLALDAALDHSTQSTIGGSQPCVWVVDSCLVAIDFPNTPSPPPATTRQISRRSPTVSRRPRSPIPPILRCLQYAEITPLNLPPTPNVEARAPLWVYILQDLAPSRIPPHLQFQGRVFPTLLVVATVDDFDTADELLWEIIEEGLVGMGRQLARGDTQRVQEWVSAWRVTILVIAGDFAQLVSANILVSTLTSLLIAAMLKIVLQQIRIWKLETQQRSATADDMACIGREVQIAGEGDDIEGIDGQGAEPANEEENKKCVAAGRSVTWLRRPKIMALVLPWPPNYFPSSNSLASIIVHPTPTPAPRFEDRDEEDVQVDNDEARRKDKGKGKAKEEDFEPDEEAEELASLEFDEREMEMAVRQSRLGPRLDENGAGPSRIYDPVSDGPSSQAVQIESEGRGLEGREDVSDDDTSFALPNRAITWLRRPRIARFIMSLSSPWSPQSPLPGNDSLVGHPTPTPAPRHGGYDEQGRYPPASLQTPRLLIAPPPSPATPALVIKPELMADAEPGNVRDRLFQPQRLLEFVFYGRWRAKKVTLTRTPVMPRLPDEGEHKDSE